MIVIIDYDMGNLASIKNMFRKIGYEDVLISKSPQDIMNADKYILPGVGAFDQGVKNLKFSGLYEVVKDEVILKKKPILGICLGMQLLGRFSEEGNLKGLELLPLNSIKFSLGDDFKIPHMGWDEVEIKKWDPLVNNMMGNEQRFYFVHSYHAKCDDASSVLMTCNYGYTFAAAVFGQNVYGVQFHPEKSHRFGKRLFENYIRI